MSNNYPVEPQSYITTTTIVSFRIEILTLVLKSSVTINAVCFNSDNNIVKTQIFNIMGEEYESWGNDDNYLVNLVAEKLGLTLENNNISITENNNIL